MKFEIRTTEIHPKKWGSEEWIVNNDRYCGKLLKFNKGAKFSNHFHLLKDESWAVLSGSFILRYKNLSNGQDLTTDLKTGDCVDIPIGFPHQLEALEDSIILEVSTTHYEEDSYRILPGDSQT
jgi:mannose-6-phosphate isomerase-like protein (cupin superfamily)